MKTSFPRIPGAFSGPKLNQPSDLVDELEHITRFRKFMNTRKAVIDGENLFDFSRKELEEKGLMRPLVFNTYESVLAGMPGLILTNVLSVLFPVKGLTYIPLNPASPYSLQCTAVAASLLSTMEKFVDPVLPPLILLLNACVVSWAVLKWRDSNRSERRWARDAFLYYDGAYGLLSQTLIAFASQLMLLLWQRHWLGLLWSLVLGILAISGMALQSQILWAKIPRLLFLLKGYDLTPYKLLQRNKPANRPPWNQYSFILMFAVSGVFCTIIAAQVSLKIYGIPWVASHLVNLKYLLNGTPKI